MLNTVNFSAVVHQYLGDWCISEDFAAGSLDHRNNGERDLRRASDRVIGTGPEVAKPKTMGCPRGAFWRRT